MPVQYSQVKIERTLDVGTYTFEIFSEDGKYGDYTFSLNSTPYIEPVSQAWKINIPNKLYINKHSIINIPLDISGASPTALLNNLQVTSNNLPAGLHLEKTTVGWSIIGDVQLSDKFSVNLQIMDSKESFSQTHQIDFELYGFTITGLKGLGRDSKVALKKLPDGTYQPLEFSFVVEGLDNTTIDNIEASFGPNLTDDTLVLGDLNECWDLYREMIKVTYSVGICPTRSDTYVTEFMNKLASVDDSERFLTLRVNLLDGTFLEQKILEPIPIERIDGFISIHKMYDDRGQVDNGRFSVEKSGESNYEQRIVRKGATTYVDYGDIVHLAWGRWKIGVDEHNMYVNLDNANCGLIFVAEHDTTENKTVLKYDRDWGAENHPLNIFVNRSMPPGAISQGLLWWLELSYRAGDIWYNATHIDEDCPGGWQVGEYNKDDVAGVRGTTFSVNHTDSNVTYDVLEGEVELVNQRVTVSTMQSYNSTSGKKTTITELDVPLEIQQYLNETSLAQSSLDGSVSKLVVSTNLAKSSYVLLGKNVRIGRGTSSNFQNVNEGLYTLHFLPVPGYKTPEDIEIIFNGTNFVEERNVNYVPDLDLNGDNSVDLMDTIIALKILTAENIQNLPLGVDINGDGKIGMEEVLAILREAGK